MLITLAYCLRDYKETRLLMEWIEELGGCRNSELLICHDARVPVVDVQDITTRSGRIFGKVTPIVGRAAIDGWPEGANYMFRTISNVLAYRKDVTSFLWLEPDSIPLTKDWLLKLEHEYAECRKPFMGDRVEVEDVPLHMSGVGIYPNPLHQFAGEAYRAHEVAWDMAAKDQIVPNAHFTRLIEHAWKHPSFTDASELTTQIRPEAVLFHASKDGSLIRILREQDEPPRVHCLLCGRGPHPDTEGHSFLPDKTFPAQVKSDETGAGSEKELVPPLAERTLQAADAASREARYSIREQRRGDMGGSGERSTSDKSETISGSSTGRGDPLQPTCDIFIRTYSGDYDWLCYCLDAIQKYATGFRHLWIVSPHREQLRIVPSEWSKGTVENPFVTWKQMNDETEDGYLAQQCTKLYADVITDYQPDYILHIDSDVILTQPVTPQSFMHEGRVVWPFTPYSEIDTPWQPIIEKFMQEKPANEFMRRFPIMVPRWLYARLREFCYLRHNMIITDYIRMQPARAFSEFNALGAYAFKYYFDRFAWINTVEEPEAMPPLFARQFRSWDGVTPEVKAEIENILNPLPGTGGPAELSSVTVATAHQMSTEPVPEQIKVLSSGIWVIEGDTHVSKWVEQEGRLDHDQNTLPFILPHITSGMTVVDIGAFIGDHTVAYAEKVETQGSVWAFEPNPFAAICLRHNLAGYRNVHIVEGALGDFHAALPLSGNNGNMAGAYVGEHMKIADVESKRLDDYRLEPSLIKIDAEGYELKILRGAEKTIEKHRPKLVLEMNWVALQRQGASYDDIYQWLREHYYVWQIMQENCHIESPMYDLLADPMSKPGVSDAGKTLVLTEPFTIHGHVRALAEHAGKGREARKYVRKLLRLEGVTPQKGKPRETKTNKRSG